MLSVYARIYGKALTEALQAIARNIWTLGLPVALVFSWLLLASALRPLGIAGGFLISLAQSAAFSIYTYFLAQVVAKQRVSFGELKTSIGAYVWTWVNLFFVLWIFDLLLQTTLSANPQGQTLLIVVTLMKFVVLNAAPETIYLKRTHGGIETITKSFSFLQENWIEWFIPNGLLLAAGWFLSGSIGRMSMVVTSVLFGAAIHVAMVFRGFLFQALDGSTHRQRMFRYRS